MLRTALAASASGVVLLALSAVPAAADEGMWTFDNFPADKVEAAFGVKIDQAWLDRVRASSVRLTNGCSASVVSSQGLVLTNHHCVVECVQDLSSGETDYVQSGFLTTSREEERKCPGMQAEIRGEIPRIPLDPRPGRGRVDLDPVCDAACPIDIRAHAYMAGDGLSGASPDGSRQSTL